MGTPSLSTPGSRRMQKLFFTGIYVICLLSDTLVQQQTVSALCLSISWLVRQGRLVVEHDLLANSMKTARRA